MVAPRMGWMLAGCLLLAVWPGVTAARIKLITLPVRERVEIQLDNPGATLVEEERIVPLVEGVNQVDFSWANTNIDAGSIVFRVLGPVENPPIQQHQAARPLEVKVLSVSYPPNENALVWQVASSGSGSARVRISYLLGNLNKSFLYRAVASRDEKALSLWQYIRLQNFANEEFLSGSDPSGSEGARLWAGFGKGFFKPVGLNETKQVLAFKYENVPVQKTYTCNPAEFGWLNQAQNKLRVPMHYVLKNDQAHHLGAAALPYGKVRIFQEDGQGSSAFIGEDWGKFTPLDDDMTLYLGVAQDIVVKRTIDASNRVRVAGNLYNQEIVIKYEIENFKDAPVTLDVAESLRWVRGQIIGETGRDVQWELGPQTTFEGGPDAEKTTLDQVRLHAKLPARDAAGKAEKIVQKLHVIFKNEW